MTEPNTGAKTIDDLVLDKLANDITEIQRAPAVTFAAFKATSDYYIQNANPETNTLEMTSKVADEMATAVFDAGAGVIVKEYGQVGQQVFEGMKTAKNKYSANSMAHILLQHHFGMSKNNLANALKEAKELSSEMLPTVYAELIKNYKQITLNDRVTRENFQFEDADKVTGYLRKLVGANPILGRIELDEKMDLPNAKNAFVKLVSQLGRDYTFNISGQYARPGAPPAGH